MPSKNCYIIIRQIQALSLEKKIDIKIIEKSTKMRTISSIYHDRNLIYSRGFDYKIAKIIKNR